MKKNKNILAAIILLLVFVVGGLIAYFTDQESKTNTFTIGNVNIALTETSWDLTDDNDNGVPDAAESLMPGQTVPKNPTIVNESTTNKAYVFMKVEVPCTTETTPKEFFTYTVNSGWTELSTAAVACTSGGTATHVYYYGTGGTLSELGVSPATTPALFNNVTLVNLTGTEGITGNKNVIATGYGIQTQGLTDTTPSGVWSNFS